MTTWIILPFAGMGILRFGMTRSSVRSVLDSPFTSFFKGNSTIETDAYDTLGFHLYYDTEDVLEFIEAYPPCTPVYQHVRFFNSPLQEILQQLALLGYEPLQDDVGYDFDQLGIGLYIPYDTLEAVAVYRRGYYESS